MNLKFPRNKALERQLDKAKDKFRAEQTKPFQKAVDDLINAMIPDLPIQEFMMGNGDCWFNLSRGSNAKVKGHYPDKPEQGEFYVEMDKLLREFETSGFRLTGKLSRHNNRLEALCELAMFIIDSRDLDCVGFNL